MQIVLHRLLAGLRCQQRTNQQLFQLDKRWLEGQREEEGDEEGDHQVAKVEAGWYNPVNIHSKVTK